MLAQDRSSLFNVGVWSRDGSAVASALRVLLTQTTHRSLVAHRTGNIMPFAPAAAKGRTATGAAARMARAQLLAKSNSTREEEAAFIFHKFNASKSGQMDEDELLRCFGELGFSNGRQNKSDEDMRKWVRQELKKGDKAGHGKLSVCCHTTTTPMLLG